MSADNLPKPDGVVKRIDCARFLVSALGLSKAAELEGIYLVPAKDAAEIPVKDAGYAAITLKMGLLPDIEGHFAADTLLTRGDGASILVRYMRSADK